MDLEDLFMQEIMRMSIDSSQYRSIVKKRRVTINDLSIDVLSNFVFKHMDARQLFTCSQVSKYWHSILTNKKRMVYTFSFLCQRDLWPRQMAQASGLFLKQYKNYMHMMKKRPRIRFDGVYICKIHYVKRGEDVQSNYHPSHDVVSYKYLRFYRNGTLMSVYTHVPPKKFLPKFYESQLSIEQLMNYDFEDDD